MKTYIKHHPVRAGVLPPKERARISSPLRAIWQMILRRKILLISTFVLLFFLPIAYLTTKNLSKSEAAWMDDNWGYRQTVAITNAGTAQTDFQVSITLNTSALITAGKMQNDCDDIRITDVNGRPLPYWLDTDSSSCNFATTKIWTKVPSISTSGNTLFLYYGNPTANSSSNFQQTFKELNVYYYDDTYYSYNDNVQTSLVNLQSAGYIKSYNTVSSTNPTISSFPTGYNVILLDQTSSTTINVVNELSSGKAIFFSAGDGSISTNLPLTSYSGADDSNQHSPYSNSLLTASIESTLPAPTWGTFSGFGADANLIGQTTVTDSAAHKVMFYSWYTSSGFFAYSAFPWDSYAQGGGGWYSPPQSALEAMLRKFMIQAGRKNASSAPSIAAPTNEEKSLGPVAYWKFDEGYGNTLNDSTSNTINLTRYDGDNGSSDGNTPPTWDDKSISVKALMFDGYDDYVSGNSSKLDFSTTDSFTISAWINSKDWHSGDQANPIVQKYGWGPHDGWMLGIRNGNCFGMNMFSRTLMPGDQTKSACITANTNISLNQWHHVVGVVDRSTNYIYFYLDGVLKISTSIASWTSANTSSFNLRIGHDGSAISGWGYSAFQGQIDEAKIYPYARSAAQIKSDFASKGSGSVKGTSAALGVNKSNKDAFSNGLIAYYKMDENTGTAVSDSSGNGNNASFAGTPSWTTGKYGTGISNGNTTGDYVNAPNVSLGTTWTASTWFQYPLTTTGSSWWTLFRGNAGDHQVIVERGASQLGMYDNVTGTGFRGTGYYMTALTTGWHHITVTGSGGTQLFYIDGNYVGQSDKQSTSDIKSIGNYWGGSQNWGTVDETRIYNRALSPKEIRDLYNFTPGPLGYWNFDEKSTSSAYDTSGNNIALSAAGLTSANIVNGKFGNAYFYNTWVQRHTATATNVCSTSTMEAWVYPLTSPSERYTIILQNGTSGQYLSIASDNSANAYWYGKSVEGYHSSGSNTVPNGRWTHIASTWDASGVSIYVNGVLKNFVASTGAPCTGTNLIIGAENAGRQMNGYIDDVKIYNYSRSSKQIVEDMNASHPAGGSPVGSQALYWKMDEGYSNNLKDTSPQNITGTFTCFGTSCSNPSWSNSGKFGKGLYFTGSGATGSYITATPINLSSTTGSQITISTWINPESTQNGGGWFLRNGVGYDENYGLNLASSPTGGYFPVGMSWYDGVGFRSMTTTGYHVPTNTWSQLTVIISQGQWMKVYINGIYKEQVNWNNANSVQATGSFNIGGHNGTTYQMFNGYLDEFKIYSSALSEDEIKLDYNHGSAMVLGSTSTDTSGNNDNSSSREYCPPGDTTGNCAVGQNPAPTVEWKLDEGTSTNIYDNSGNGYAGTINGNVSWTVGKFGNALKNNSNNAGIITSSSVSLGSTFTFEFWSKKLTNITNSWEIFLGDNSSNDIFFIGNGGGNSSFGGDGIGQWSYEWNSLSTGQYHHIVYARNGTSHTLYVDGINRGTLTATGSNINETKFFVWGADPNTYGFVSGTYDMVRIYNYVRSPAQIAYDYNRGGPVGHWKFDECQGNQAYDSSGNGNVGTITIGATAPQTSVGTCTDGLSTSAWYNGVTGKYSNSLKFDGVDDSMSVTIPSLSNNRGSFSEWVKPSGWNGGDGSYHGTFQTMGIGSWGNNVGQMIVLNQWYDTFYFRIVPDAGCCGLDVTFNTTGVFQDGVWTNIVTTWDSTSHVIAIYVNGVLKASRSDFNTAITTPINTSDYMGIGHDSYWTGQLDDVRVYNYALTPTQIKGLFNEGSAVRFGPVTGSP